MLRRKLQNSRVGLVAATVFYLAVGCVLWVLLDSYVDPESATDVVSKTTTVIADPNASEADKSAASEAVKVASATVTAKKDLAQALGFIMAGLAGAFGIYYTWRNLIQNREGQITERYTNAVAQLGATKNEGKEKLLELRLGGIYALEGIAREDPDKQHGPVMQVLSGYLRENSAWENDGRVKHDADIQAALTVIVRLGRQNKAGNFDPIDLSGADLFNLDFRRASLEGAKLRRSHLERADLRNSQLPKADFRNADLEGADFSGANLQGADLRGARLDGADFRGAQLKGALVNAASFKKANLKGVVLSKVKGLDQEQLDQANGDETTKLPAKTDVEDPPFWHKLPFLYTPDPVPTKTNVEKPAWWLTLPPQETTLASSTRYSIKVSDTPLFFTGDPYWQAGLRLPNTFYLTPKDSVTFAGPMISFNYLENVCDPKKPHEAECSETVPDTERKWIDWFKHNGYLTIESNQKVEVGGISGIQFDLAVKADKQFRYLPTCNRPCVPLFYQQRARPNRMFKGNRNQIIILKVNEQTIAIFIEARSEEPQKFFTEVDSLLSTVQWG